MITVNMKMKLMCKETVVIHLVPYSTIYLEGMRKDTKTFDQSILSVDWH